MGILMGMPQGLQAYHKGNLYLKLRLIVESNLLSSQSTYIGCLVYMIPTGSFSQVTELTVENSEKFIAKWYALILMLNWVSFFNFEQLPTFLRFKRFVK